MRLISEPTLEAPSIENSVWVYRYINTGILGKQAHIPHLLQILGSKHLQVWTNHVASSSHFHEHLEWSATSVGMSKGCEGCKEKAGGTKWSGGEGRKEKRKRGREEEVEEKGRMMKDGRVRE